MASVDNLKDNTAFAKKENASFPILADPEKKLTSACDVLYKEGFAKGFAKRWTFYVDKNGTIVKIDRKVNPATAGEVLAKNLEALGFPKK